MFAKTFRNTLIASTLVIAGAALATPANAQELQQDVDVPLSGEVASSTQIFAFPTPESMDLDLGGEGLATPGVVENVARLDIVSNNFDGVMVTATADSLLTSTDSTDTLAYQVMIASAEPDAGDFAAGPHSVNILRGTGGIENGEATRDLFIQYDAPLVLNKGTYTSNISVTIADL